MTASATVRPFHGASADPRALFESELPRIEKVVQYVRLRHHMSSHEGDDFSSWVFLQLMENDFAILRKFQGRSSLRTYLTTVVQRLYLDYRIKEWGKWRPSARAKALGPTAVKLELLVNRRGLSRAEAVETLATQGIPGLSRSELEELAEATPERRRRRFESDEILERLPSEELQPDRALLERELENSRVNALSALRFAMKELDDEDRMILEMRYPGGLNVRQVAAVVGLDSKALYRRLDRIQKHLRELMEKVGVCAQDVESILAGAGRPLALVPDEGGDPLPSVRLRNQEHERTE